MNPDDARDGADAVADILRVAFRVDVGKATIDPTTRAGYEVVVGRVTRALDRATVGFEADAVRAALDTLDVDWSTLTPDGVDRVLTAAREAIGVAEARAMPAVSRVFEAYGAPTQVATREAAVKRFGFSIQTTLSARDKRAEAFVRSSSANFIRDEYGRRRADLAQAARDVVARGLAEGLGRYEISRDLRDTLGDRVTRGPSYWQIVAGQFVNSARTFSSLEAYREAGIEQYVFVAVMDEVTTEQCRFYHGQKFGVEESIAQADKLMTAAEANPDAVYDVNPWVRTGTDEDGNGIIYYDRGGERVVVANVATPGYGTRDAAGSYTNAMTTKQLTDAGIPYPPLHANCRSEIEPVVG